MRALHVWYAMENFYGVIFLRTLGLYASAKNFRPLPVFLALSLLGAGRFSHTDLVRHHLSISYFKG